MTENHTLRTTVPPHVFDVLDKEAASRGVTLAALTRSILTRYVTDRDLSRPAADTRPDPHVPTVKEWTALRSWVAADPTVLSGYTGERIWTKEENRAAVYAYALTLGFQP